MDRGIIEHFWKSRISSDIKDQKDWFEIMLANLDTYLVGGQNAAQSVQR